MSELNVQNIGTDRNASLVVDSRLIADVLGVSKSASLAGTVDEWCGVAERAEQLGIAVGLVTKHRSQLGKVVKPLISQSDRREEKRLCNGTQRVINLYRVTEVLDSAICGYFGIGVAS